MKKYICTSVLLFTVFGGSALYAEEKTKSDSFNQEAFIKYIEKKYPFKEWKTIGFCDDNKVPLTTMKVPSFMNWPSDCDYHTVKDGVEYCGPGEASPRMTGSVIIDGKERVLQIGMEVFRSKEFYKTYYDDPFKSEYDSSVVLSSRAIMLGGYKSFLGEIEDTANKLEGPTKIMTIIKYSHGYIGGKLYFIDYENKNGEYRFIKHKDWAFQPTVDKIMESFVFKVKKIDSPNPYEKKSVDAKKN